MTSGNYIVCFTLSNLRLFQSVLEIQVPRRFIAADALVSGLVRGICIPFSNFFYPFLLADLWKESERPWFLNPFSYFFWIFRIELWWHCHNNKLLLVFLGSSQRNQGRRDALPRRAKESVSLNQDSDAELYSTHSNHWSYEVHVGLVIPPERTWTVSRRKSTS